MFVLTNCRLHFGHVHSGRDVMFLRPMTQSPASNIRSTLLCNLCGFSVSLWLSSRNGPELNHRDTEIHRGTQRVES